MEKSALQDTWHVIGLMSGSSLDGLDVAVCRFQRHAEQWDYSLVWANTFSFDVNLLSRLMEAPQSAAFELAETDALFARFSGKAIVDSLHEIAVMPDFVSSHGHTIFHQPGAGFTTQIGNGGLISAVCGLPVVSDFRTIDVGLGGQGAPLVPIGDKLLFPGYDGYLNLGGIANLTVNGSLLKAFDICACNQWFNYLANQIGYDFDLNGNLALSGRSNVVLVERLKHAFNSQTGSISNEYVRSTFQLLDESKVSIKDKMASCVEAAGNLIGDALAQYKIKKVLVTGGGVFNPALLQAISLGHKGTFELVVPDEQTVQYKEAIIFGFLGLLRWLGETNVEKSVTGAHQNHVAGCIYSPF
jgi:anhydro-N-acetylmuramic acid kinase